MWKMHGMHWFVCREPRVGKRPLRLPPPLSSQNTKIRPTEGRAK